MTKVRKSRISGTILLTIIICFLSFPAYSKYGGGIGEPNDPYLIYTAEQMNEIGLHQDDWDKHFKLMSDIDLGSFTGTSYNIIGSWSWNEWDNPFTGVFDGNNKNISNFNHSSIGRDRVGIFGYINNPDAEIKDLGLIDPEVNSGTGVNVGSLVGLAEAGAITNCYVKGGSISGYDGIGGLVGMSYGSTIINCYTTTSVSGNKKIGGLTGNAGKITNCYATGDVSGYAKVGGLVGDNTVGTITDCHSSATVTGTYYVGGLVGDNQVGTITNCCSKASVTGTYYAGGLVGDNRVGTITDCYSCATVKGSNSIGGLVGTNEWGTITNCFSIGRVDGLINVGGLVGYITGCISASFWDTQTSGQAISCGGTGLTTAEMQLESTFTNAGWDFVGENSNGTKDNWSICEGVDYPKLAWQSIIGDFNSDSKVDFTDFAIFAEHWNGTGSSFFSETDLTNDDNVDFADLKELADNWLRDGI